MESAYMRQLAPSIDKRGEAAAAGNAPAAAPGSLSKADACAAICGIQNHVEMPKSCKTRWEPEYEDKEGCRCLKSYHCCKEKCPVIDTDVCNRLDEAGGIPGKGFSFGINETDCCGCPAMKCLPCEPPLTKEESECDTSKGCFAFIQHNRYEKILHSFNGFCWQSKCKATPTIYAKPNCDLRCQEVGEKIDVCGTPYQECADNKPFVTTCLDAKFPMQGDCFEPPKQKSAQGFYNKAVRSSGSQCEQCHRWQSDPLSCDDRDAAAEQHNCRKHASGLSTICWSKVVNKDSCGCNQADCVVNEESCRQTFAPDAACPPKHKKVKGVSICNHAREICVKCPSQVPVPRCKHGKVYKDTDVNGCPMLRCQPTPSWKIPRSCVSGLYKLEEHMDGSTHLVCQDGDVRCRESNYIDLQLIVDQSSSIGKKNFGKVMHDLAEELIGSLEIGKDKSHVALTKFSTEPSLEFNLTRYTTNDQIKTNLLESKLKGGLTYAAAALKAAWPQFDNQARWNNTNIKKVLLYFTDGDAHDENKISTEVAPWRSKDVKIFVIGIGTLVKEAGLLKFTEDPNSVFHADSFSEFYDALAKVIARICPGTWVPKNIAIAERSIK